MQLILYIFTKNVCQDYDIFKHTAKTKEKLWRDKGEMIRQQEEHAFYEGEQEGINQISDSTAPQIRDPLSYSLLSYLNGGGGSGKTTRAIDTFRSKNPLVFTPTHRLAKEMRDTKNVKAQTYHSFFRWSGQKEWTEDRMGKKFIPRVIIWDEVCTVPENILKTFLDWLQKRNVQIICCGDHGQPPPISGPSPHNWLKEHADYYEEVQTDYRAKCPRLREFKKKIRLRSDRYQCKKMRAVLTKCLKWNELIQKWNPEHLILTSRKAVRDRVQKSLFEIQSKHF